MIFAVSIVCFVLLLVVELIWSRRTGVRLYTWGDTLTNLGAQAFERVFSVLAAVPVYLAYAWVYEFRLFDGWPAGLAFVVAIVLQDLGFYWWHRASHRVSLLWWGHSAHHSSEQFNVSVALRASGWNSVTQRVFLLPLALLGVPIGYVAIADGLAALYTLFVHTRIVPRIPYLEWVLVTPSVHRVHHARNPRYLDKNYGGTFSVWDRLFGTFQAEEEPCVYGLVAPLKTHNVAWVRFHVLFEIVSKMRRSRRLWDALAAPFRPPAWDPDGDYDLQSPAVPTQLDEVPAVGWSRTYAVLQYVLLLAGVFVFFFFGAELPYGVTLAWALWLFVSFGVLGGLLEKRRWAPSVEVARWCACVTLGALTLAL